MTRAHRIGVLTLATGIAATAMLVVALTAAAAGRAVCGKNLIKNPGADARARRECGQRVRRRSRVDGRGGPVRRRFVHVPERSVLGEAKGPAKRGKNYFFGGATTEAVTAGGEHRNANDRAARSPPSGKKATLSGWIGNHGENRSQVRAQFMDASGSGAVDRQDRPGGDDRRQGHGVRTPERQGACGATQVMISVIFSGGAPTTSSQERTAFRSC